MGGEIATFAPPKGAQEEAILRCSKGMEVAIGEGDDE